MASSSTAEATARSPRVELILAQLEQWPTLSAVAARLGPMTASETSAVLAVRTYELFSTAEPPGGSIFDRVEFWKYSLAVGCAARLIAERRRKERLGDEAFVCGLLHDLGQVALDACLPKSYARVLRRARAMGRCLCDVERELLGVDHTVAGKRLATRWKLPSSIVECIWLHHQPIASLPGTLRSRELVEMVCLADQMVRYHRIGYSGDAFVEPPESAARTVGLEPADLVDIFKALPEQLERYRRLVGIEERSGPEVHAQTVSPANAELARVNGALAEANRRLTVRARCIEALSRFHQGLGLDDPPAGVCLAAARCVREALDLEAAVGFYGEAEASLCHFGVSNPPGDRVEVLPAPPAVPAGNAGHVRPPGEYLISAGVPPSAEAALQHFRRTYGAGPIRLWPMTHGGLAIGGVLFRSAAERSAALPSAAEVEAFGVAFGLAVAGAADRARSERLNEELAHATRQLHQARRELLRAQSITMIARMAAGAAHELNNPLAVISGRAQMLACGTTDPEPRRLAEIIHQHAQRASDIVSELVHFAKPEQPQPVVVSLADWIEQLRAEWTERSSLKPSQLRVSLADPAVCLRADAGQLRQIFDALLANAVDATSPENARVLINSASASSDDTIVITVEDNGVGMAAEVLEHAVDPFFSHRAAGRGRGMGLSHASRLATNNGGRLWLTSAPGVGTTVFVELPNA